jgi:hypothetical protein
VSATCAAQLIAFNPHAAISCPAAIVPCVACIAKLNECGARVQSFSCVGPHCTPGHCEQGFRVAVANCRANTGAVSPCNEPRTCCDHTTLANNSTTGQCCSPLCGPSGLYTGTCNAKFSNGFPRGCYCPGQAPNSDFTCSAGCGSPGTGCGNYQWEASPCPDWQSGLVCSPNCCWSVVSYDYYNTQCAP